MNKLSFLAYPLFFFALSGLFGFEWPITAIFYPANAEALGSSQWYAKEINNLTTQKDHIDPHLLRLGLNAYVKARHQGLDSKEVLTVIDYSKPSSEKRLWVFDIKHMRTLFHTWVSHGKNSGAAIAQSFSNSPGSLKSSLGVFLTDSDPYIGNHGYSLRLNGLEPGINDNAYRRDIVIHGAWYVNEDIVKHYGAVGRSFGCPAVSSELSQPLINTIKQRTLVFAYYPDSHWLSHSNFVNNA
ncbi:MAG: hypothetical protein A3F43_03320 [Gammaproteobacteria bacterium RIFCSPHIGHO2_12_FULL_42_10]|nr:MAG: hypothetical protein A3F43_03320 [Gammaproteobacteria bacterium RIFCSPHIGHO2_12_FULL_42_10]